MWEFNILICCKSTKDYKRVMLGIWRSCSITNLTFSLIILMIWNIEKKNFICLIIFVRMIELSYVVNYQLYKLWKNLYRNSSKMKMEDEIRFVRNNIYRTDEMLATENKILGEFSPEVSEEVLDYHKSLPGYSGWLMD